MSCRQFESSELLSPETQMGRLLWGLLPLEDYSQTRHGLILPAERASACVQDSA